MVDVGAGCRDLVPSDRDLDEAEGLIQIDQETLGGEPVFKGSRIAVYSVVAMLAAGTEVSEVLSGYPKLSERQLELGRLWVATHPRSGRPKRLADFGFRLISTRRCPLPADPLEKTDEVADA
jgi:uncharacterized protein (DUF433 family)